MNIILVIEDNSGVAELICDTLNELGYTTIVALNGKTAVEILAQSHVDMVLLDYSLPDMDGKQLIAAVDESGLRMPPFIVSTGRGDEQLAVDMMKLGAYDYLIKDKTIINRLPEVVAKLGHDLMREKELLEAQQALVKSEERFRNLVEKASDFFIKLSTEGEFVYVSPNWHDKMGYSANDTESLSIYELIHNEDKTLFQSQISNLIEEEDRHFTAEFRVYDANGTIRYHNFKGYSVVENQQVVLNCIARDVTEEKLVEKRLARAVFQAEEEEKKKFAEELHEDIGPLVSAIKMAMGRIRSMQGFTPDQLKVIEYCDNLVDQAVSKVRNLANDLRPNIISDFGLVKAIKSYMVKLEESHPVKIIFKASAHIPEPNPSISIILYRTIASLALQSIRLYNVSEVIINLDAENDNIILSYQDNASENDQTPDVGSMETLFVNLHKRINSVDGSMESGNIGSVPVKVKVTVPLESNKQLESAG